LLLLHANNYEQCVRTEMHAFMILLTSHKQERSRYKLTERVREEAEMRLVVFLSVAATLVL
jgi:hypothetical protein